MEKTIVEFKKSARIRVALTSMIYLAMIAFCAFFFSVRIKDTLEGIYILNVSVDIFGMIAGYIIFVACLIDVQKTGMDHRYYLHLLNAVFFGLFTDGMAWMVDGIPGLRFWNILDNTLYYMCMPASACLFWFYVSEQLTLDSKGARIYGRFVFGGMVVMLLLTIGNIFGKYYFTVTEDGVYHREAFYALHQIYGYAVIFAALGTVIKKRRLLEVYQRNALYLYVASPMIVGLLSILHYGLSLTYAAEMLVMLLMYCVLNVSQGRETAAAGRELQMAAAIQERVLPQIFPPFPERREFDLFASMKPAKEVGGDFYDFFLIDEDHLGMVIADVSGKGVPAALFMMIAKTLLKNRLQNGDSPAQALSSVNEQLMEGEDGASMFVTVWLAVFEISSGKGVAGNAGHEHPAMRRRNGQFELLEYPHSPMVAAVSGISFREHEFEMQPGDTLFVYTDGVPEAIDSRNKPFGTDSMLMALNAGQSTEPEGLIRSVKDAMDRFVGNAEQFDDITMLCFHYRGTVSE